MKNKGYANFFFFFGGGGGGGGQITCIMGDVQVAYRKQASLPPSITPLHKLNLRVFSYPGYSSI